MAIPETDMRSPEQRARDEHIASEPKLPPPILPTDLVSSPIETHLRRLHRQPVAITGVVENGVVRPLDPAIKLPEHARVIIVAEAG